MIFEKRPLNQRSFFMAPSPLNPPKGEIHERGVANVGLMTNNKKLTTNFFHRREGEKLEFTQR